MVNLREIANGMMYILSTGCQWRAIPKDLPPRSTLHDYFDLWGWDGTLDSIHHALYVECRERAQREASPTAAIIDSQSVVHAPDIQDRDGGVLLMATLFGLYPFLLNLYADGGYQGAGFQGALRNILKRVNVAELQ
jgi:transposase